MTRGVRRAGRPRMDAGVLSVDGRPRLLLAGEYPYYRDQPASWEPKLRAMADAGLEVVSFYVPWRHHEIDDGDGARHLRFDGEDNRNLAGFLERVARCGLLAIAKPGPFVHAELPFGGFPDRLSPTLDSPRQGACSATGDPLRSQRFVLPASACPAFAGDAGVWLGAVGGFLRPWQYPDGPIVAVQVGNEGLYGEAGLEIDAHDYSPCAVAAFGTFAGGREPPRRWPDGPTAADVTTLLDWGSWVAESLARAIRGIADGLDLEVPLLVNLPPPARSERHRNRPAGRYDAWLVRNRPELLGGINYGFTNWVGNVVRDDEALVNYVLAAKRGRGPNIEENWSLRWVDAECACAAVPIYHALVSIACGATGIDVYTACATGSWGPHLSIDREFLRETTGDPGVLDPPYGDGAPIDVDGRPGPSFDALRLLTSFLADAGPAIVEARPPRGVTWCLDSRGAALQAWGPPAHAAVAGRALAPSAGTLAAFASYCLRRAIPFALADLHDEASWPAAADAPLALTAGWFMDGAAQKRLAALVDAGRALLLIGEVPQLDEHFQPCTILFEALRAAEGRPEILIVEPNSDADLPGLLDGWVAELPEVAAQPEDPTRLELQLVGAGTFVFLFNRLDEKQRLVTTVGDVPVSVQLPPFGSAALHVSGGSLIAGFVKGITEQCGCGVPTMIEVGAEWVSSRHPCDLVVLRQGGDLVVRSCGGGPDNTVAAFPGTGGAGPAKP